MKLFAFVMMLLAAVAVALVHFFQFPDSSFRERPIRRVEFRPIKSKRPGSQNLSSIGSRTVGTAMLFSVIDSRPYRNGHRYLAPVNDYRQRSETLPPMSMSRDRLSECRVMSGHYSVVATFSAATEKCTGPLSPPLGISFLPKSSDGLLLHSPIFYSFPKRRQCASDSFEELLECVLNAYRCRNNHLRSHQRERPTIAHRRDNSDLVLPDVPIFTGRPNYR
ncbi:hypothetical protein EVAR_93282_1 [Eumeta japonica]|uniref:Uncharacterized protein n=1 Tax=Eumeta variegata TaxID=151549 RepID=A0A4C1TXS7_EUMVA|nr:hypothetical protein EVAR_93282_1 [Eumeta japonica]